MRSKLLFIVGILFLSSILIKAEEPPNRIEFETFLADSGEQHLRIQLKWEEDPDIIAFKVYSVPSNTLLLVCAKNGLPKDQLDTLFSTKSKVAAIGIGEVTVELNDYLVENDHGFKLTKILAGELTEEQLMKNRVQEFTGIYQVGAGFPGKNQ